MSGLALSGSGIFNLLLPLKELSSNPEVTMVSGGGEKTVFNDMVVRPGLALVLKTTRYMPRGVMCASSFTWLFSPTVFRSGCAKLKFNSRGRSSP